MFNFTGDQEGECRSHGNLGAAYHSKGNYREALTHQRCQLVLAMRLKQHDTASSALSSLGHVYTAIGDYPNALSSHKQCVIALNQVGDPLRKAREIGENEKNLSGEGWEWVVVVLHYHIEIMDNLFYILI